MSKIHIFWIVVIAALVYVFFLKGKGGFPLFSADKPLHSVPNVKGATSAPTSPTGTFGAEV
jgi:hypothetical protein